MQRDEVIARLREIAESRDDWFSIWETDEGGWQVADSTGNAAAIVVEDHWVEVRAGRPLGSGSWRLPAAGGAASLVHITLDGDDVPVVSYRARVYLDGFSLQALFLAVRDVLALAGPLPLASVSEPDLEPAVEVSVPAMAEVPAPEMRGEPPAEQEPAAAPEEPVEPTGATVAATAEDVPAPAESSITTEDAPMVPASVEEAPVAPDMPEAPEAAVAAADVTEAAAAATEAPPAAQTGPAEEPRVSSVGATVAIRRPPSGEPATPPTVETPIPPKPARQTCRRCGAEVEPGERFCINCGAPQPVGETTQATQATEPTASTARRSEPDTVAWRRPPPGAVLCPRCGTTNPEASLECLSCGLSLVGVAAQAGAPPATDTKTCSRCGYANPAGNRFCQGCGTALAGSA